MTYENHDNVVFFDPDRRLQIKIGTLKLDDVFPPTAVEKAQWVIEEAADSFLEEGLRSFAKLKQDYETLSHSPSQRKDILPRIADNAFRLKTESSIARCLLVSEIAKSLQLHAEKAIKDGLYPRNYIILDWHIASLCKLLKHSVRGMGGQTGRAILAELRKIHPCPEEEAFAQASA